MTVGTGKYMNPRDGDVVEYALQVRNGEIVVNATRIHGCIAVSAAAEELVRMVSLRSPSYARTIQARDLVGTLGLAEDEERCALTAIAALRAALVDAHVKELA